MQHTVWLLPAELSRWSSFRTFRSSRRPNVTRLAGKGSILPNSPNTLRQPSYPCLLLMTSVPALAFLQVRDPAGHHVRGALRPRVLCGLRPGPAVPATAR